ncbi:stalk domain-containing protein [Cytobacillus sp. FJAT-54145]|uniref:Stalk domain-containing protein n=1 Tax=Cytobacillus spartinae TaxID=3299023 RepID=A0ABW6KKC0_9BACI
MWKTTFTILLLLLSTLGGMLFWQWHAYSEQNDEVPIEQIEQAEQLLTVQSSINQLEITQTIEGLNSTKEYRFTIPGEATQWSCLKEDGSNCDSKDENPNSFLAESGKLRFVLTIPLKGNNSSFLYHDWFVVLPEVSVTNTMIEIVDSAKREGSWVTGLPLKGFNKLDYIDYYVFEGQRTEASLFWQSTPLTLKRQNTISYFIGESHGEVNYSFEALKELTNPPQLSIVLTNEYPDTNGKGLIITKPDVELNVLERKIVHTYMSGKFEKLPLEEQWLLDVFTSLFINKESKAQKGMQLINELKEKLSEEELKRYMQAIIQEDQPINTQKLDELLGTMSGKRTYFFTINKNESTQFIPLYYFDNRKVFVESNLKEDVEIVYMDGKTLFPFVETLTALGFEVKVLSDQETLLLSKGNNSYRFYLNQNIFIYNEEDYGLLENPLNSLNGKIYMDHHWLKSIFHISISEQQDKIELSW